MRHLEGKGGKGSGREDVDRICIAGLMGLGNTFLSRYSLHLCKYLIYIHNKYLQYPQHHPTHHPRLGSWLRLSFVLDRGNV